MLRILTILGLAMICFSWWGLETPAGNRQFDEMAGMIPEFSGVVGALFLVASAGIWLYRATKKRRQR